MTNENYVTRIEDLGVASTYKYALVLTIHNKQLLLSRHRDRLTWETQGGKVEKGESVEQAAERELFEESGVRPKTVTPLFDYWAGQNESGDWGRLFVATVDHIQQIPPESEMIEVRWFAEVPSAEELTYPWMRPAIEKVFSEVS